MSKPTRVVPANAVALIVSKDPTEGFLDLQVLPPENGDVEYLTTVGNLAANLLEHAMFGEEAEPEDEEGLELDPSFMVGIDFGEDE